MLFYFVINIYDFYWEYSAHFMEHRFHSLVIIRYQDKYELFVNVHFFNIKRCIRCNKWILQERILDVVEKLLSFQRIFPGKASSNRKFISYIIIWCYIRFYVTIVDTPLLVKPLTLWCAFNCKNVFSSSIVLICRWKTLMIMKVRGFDNSFLFTKIG